MEQASKNDTSDIWVDIISMDMYKCMQFLKWTGYELVQRDLKGEIPDKMIESYTYYAEELKKGADFNNLAEMELAKGEYYKKRYKEYETVIALWYFTKVDRKKCIDILKASRYIFLDYCGVLEYDIVKEMIEDRTTIDKEIKYLEVKIKMENFNGFDEGVKEQTLSMLKLRLILRQFERALLNNDFTDKNSFMEALALIVDNICLSF